MKKSAVIIFILSMMASSLSAQTGKNSSISGTVHCTDGNHPIDFASVVLPRSNQYTLTDKEGNFSIKNVPAGEVLLSIQFFGMEQLDTLVVVPKNGKNIHLKLMMTPTSFHIDNVTVIATQNKAGSSTASNISRQAMDHLQTSSLKDVMSLLPGVSITNPSLSDAQSVSIRSNSGLAINSLGTAVIVDGAPMSNNANLQVLTTSIAGKTNAGEISGNASASTGVDIRGLSTDNVESVEVIRGIPSVEYGDMTAGAVIVKSKAGKSPLTIRFKTNPNIYQAAAAKGFGLGKRGGDLNISADYAYNRRELINNLDKYQRANVKGLWSIMFAGNSTANTSLSLSYGKQNRDRNPDDMQITESKAENINVTFNHNGKAFVNRTWLKSINWLLSGSYSDKVSYYRSTATNAFNMYSTAMTDGIYTNVPGMEYKDIDGNTITTLHHDKTIKGTMMYTYPYRYNIYGKELNAFAKVNCDMGHSWGNVSERLLVGVDFKTDGNLGKGAVYDDDTPPYRDNSNTASGYRKRPYYDIPFINQIGVYAENIFSWRFARRELNITAGVRYDWINGKDVLAPRINASIDAFPWMTIRGGWGITSKAPTSIYLYPNKAYQDFIIYNGDDVNLPENERLLIGQTTVYDTENPNLEIATNRKAEIGIDFNIAKQYRISITAYDELMENGYNFGLSPDCFHYYTIPKYIAAEKVAGSRPVLQKVGENSSFFTTYKPMNNVISHNMGIEYEINLGRFKTINTSFYINGAWMRGEYTNGGYSYSTIKPSGYSEVKDIGIYAPKTSTDYTESFNTTLRITHNIPRIGFAITLTGQFNWYSKFWTEYKKIGTEWADTQFVGIIQNSTGKIDWFSKNNNAYEIIAKNESVRNDPNFAYLYPIRSDNRFLVERYIPYAIFNLNLTKEIKDFITASFYVNNMFNRRKLHKKTASTGYTELGIPMYFGFELKVTIK